MNKSLLIAIVIIIAASICLAQDISQNGPNKLYPFSFNYKNEYTILRLFPTPDGYERYPERDMSKYQAWLTNLPVWPNYYKVALWSAHDTVAVGRVAAIIDFGVKSRNQTDLNIPLQLLWAARRVFNQPEKIEYILSPKDTVTYSRWLSGKYVLDGVGNLVYKMAEKREHTAQEYFRFVEFIADKNNGRRLIQNCRKTDWKNIEPGDLYIQFREDDTDSTGHAAIILDICQNQSGDKLLMAAWGGNPAHSFFIPKSPDPQRGPWLTLDEFKARLSEYGPGEFYIFARE